ncbi:hypothetical protein RJT34_31427 [Clitoria ternatea]|uniref:Uncharacterized protein n=1 Tax=Clitoria ternatea TaxID=43366 RepID=A0AAN9I4Z1_CLITE
MQKTRLYSACVSVACCLRDACTGHACKQCPYGCEYAVTFDAGSGNYDVSCLCVHIAFVGIALRRFIDQWSVRLWQSGFEEYCRV